MEKYKVIAYLADWTDWEVEEVDVSKLTHINYAFATIEEGRVVGKVVGKKLKKIKLLKELKKRNPQLKTLISIGGWAADGFSDAALTKESRALFADTAIEFMKKYDFDGIDIDWEYPCSSMAGIVARPEDKENFTLLLKETRERLDREEEVDNRKYLLTIAVGASQQFVDDTEMDKVHEYLDFINLMTYDFATGIDEKTGHHTNPFDSKLEPKNSTKATVELFKGQGIPASKIIVGVAFYGRAWSGVGPEKNGLGQKGKPGADGFDTTFTNIFNNLINKNGFVKYWDDDAKAPYLYNGDIFISYEDEESVGYKVDYIKENSLGGAMFWEYASDKTGALLNVLYNGLKE